MLDPPGGHGTLALARGSLAVWTKITLWARRTRQRSQYPLVKEYTLIDVGILKKRVKAYSIIIIKGYWARWGSNRN